MDSSLYERLGGKDGISAVVQSFSGRVGGDARINQKFARTNVPRLRALLAEQICEATGGPFVYTGRGMKESHAGMAVTEGEFDAMVDDLTAALDEHKVARTISARCSPSLRHYAIRSSRWTRLRLGRRSPIRSSPLPKAPPRST